MRIVSIVGLLLLLLLAGLLWLVLGSDGGVDPAPAAEPRAGASDARAPAAAAGRFHVVAAAAAPVIDGRVVWFDDASVPAATIQVLPDGDPSGESWLRADPGGSFRVALEGDAEHFVLVAHHGNRRSGEATVRSGSDPGVVVLRFTGVPRIRGRVLDADGAPVHARVVAYSLSPDGTARPTVGVGRPDGSYFVDVEPGRHGLLAWAEGHVISRWRPITVVSDGGTAWCELRVRRAAPLHGVVVHEDGRPLAGFEVEATMLDRTDLVDARGVKRVRVPRGFAGPTALLSPFDEWGRAAEAMMPSTREEGRFLFRGLAAGVRYRLRCARNSDGRDVASTIATPESSPVRIVVPAAELVTASATVRFFAPEGERRRVNRVRVRARRGDGSRYWPGSQRSEDRLDVKVSPLEPGSEFRIGAGVDGWGYDEFGPWIAPVGHATFDVHLPVLGEALCRVRDADGAPRPRIRIAATTPAQPRRWLGTTNRRGEWLFERMPPGDWKFFVIEDGVESATAVTVPAGRRIAVDLR